MKWIGQNGAATMKIFMMMKDKTNFMRHFFKKTKKYFKQIMKQNNGDLNYEKFEKLERKKYQKQNQHDYETHQRHDPFSCTDACFRKR